MEHAKLVRTARALDVFAKILDVVCRIALGTLVVMIPVVLLAKDMSMGTVRRSLDLGPLRLRFYPETGLTPDDAVMAVLPLLITTAVIAAAVWYTVRIARRVLAPMKEGRPFAPTVADDLNRLGWVWIIVGGAGSLARAITETVTLARLPMDELFNRALVDQVDVTISVDLTFLVVAGVIFLLSYIFRYGQQLQQESDETL